jgi:competence protein ComEA
MKETFENHKTKWLAAGVIMVLVILYISFRSTEKEGIAIEEISPLLVNEPLQTEIDPIDEKPTIIMVDVKGEVKSPGVYHAEEGERVIDLITKSGGFTEDADQNQVNLSLHVEDEMVIFVPKTGEVDGNFENEIGKQKSSLININKATDSELQTLPGIGPSKAMAIKEYRETNGGFETIEDLKKISGIGEKTFEKLAPLISVK